MDSLHRLKQKISTCWRSKKRDFPEKNDEAFPQNSRYLSESKINPEELDAVQSQVIWPFDDTIVRKSQWKVEDYLKEQQIRWKPF